MKIVATVLFSLSLAGCLYTDGNTSPKLGLVNGQGECEPIAAKVSHKHPCSVHYGAIERTSGQN
jgi:hypothetical protein